MNALITKLPSSVDDITLGGINEIGFKIETESVYRVTVRNKNNPKMYKYRLTGDGHFTNQAGTANYGQVYENPTYDGLNIFISAGTSYLFINKWDLVYLSTIEDKMSLSYSSFKNSSLQSIVISNIFGKDGNPWNVEELASPDLKTIIALSDNKVAGDIHNLLNFSTAVEINTTGQTQLVGELKAADKMPSISTFIINRSGITGTIMCLTDSTSALKVECAGTAVSGNLEDLLDAMHSAGRVSGTCRFNVINSGVKYRGSEISAVKLATFDANGWTLSDYT